MARIAGINVPTQKHTVIALTSIYGIGPTRARDICVAAKVEPSKKNSRFCLLRKFDALRAAVAEYQVEGDLRRSGFHEY